VARSLEALVTVREVARACHRTAETIRRWIWNGKLPASKLGNQLFVKREDLARVGRGQARRVPGGTGGAAEKHRYPNQFDVLRRARVLRDRIRRRVGGTVDVLTVLDRSRERHS